MERIENSTVDRFRQQPSARGWPNRMLRSGCFVLALGMHATVVAALIVHWHNDSDAIWSAPIITVDLAAKAAAPAVMTTGLPPGPVKPQQEAQPQPAHEKPVEKTEIASEPEKLSEKIDVAPERVKKSELAILSPAKPVEKPKQKEQRKPRGKLASLASAPNSAERHVEHAVAPEPGASAHNPNAVPNWKSRLVAWLERYKRYPPEAQSHGDHGMVQLAFFVDRSGHVHHARILHSSGSRLLDAATLSLVERAAPLPAPPPEVTGTQIAIVVPIKYNIR